MQQASQIIPQLKLLDSTSYRNLTIFPICSMVGSDVEYLLLEDAVRQGLLYIHEVSPAGSVPELLVENKGEKPVLIMDGQELVGAKQNRVVNLTILVAGARTTVIPVSCVEQGRWSATSADFAVANRAQFSRGRAEKLASVHSSMRSDGTRRSDQHRIWASIREKADLMDAGSATGAMGAIFDKHRASLDQYLKPFKICAHQIGAVFAVGSDITGVDFFDKPSTFSSLFTKLIRSYAIDALEQAEAHVEPPSSDDARRFLERIGDATTERYPAVGLGSDIRLVADSLIAGGLLVDDTVVHLTAFADPTEHGSNRRYRSDITASSWKRRHTIRRRFH